jgi:hypothetical protein
MVINCLLSLTVLAVDNSPDFSPRHLEVDNSLDFSPRHLEVDNSLDFSLRHLEVDSSLDSSPRHLVEDSKGSRHLEEEHKKAGRHLHLHLHTRHKSHPLYMQLTLEQSEAVFTALPMFGLTTAAVSGFIQPMLEEIQLPVIVGEDSAGYITELI